MIGAIQSVDVLVYRGVPQAVSRARVHPAQAVSDKPSGQRAPRYVVDGEPGAVFEKFA